MPQQSSRLIFSRSSSEALFCSLENLPLYIEYSNSMRSLTTPCLASEFQPLHSSMPEPYLKTEPITDILHWKAASLRIPWQTSPNSRFSGFIAPHLLVELLLPYKKSIKLRSHTPNIKERQGCLSFSPSRDRHPTLNFRIVLQHSCAQIQSEQQSINPFKQN